MIGILAKVSNVFEVLCLLTKVSVLINDHLDSVSNIVSSVDIHFALNMFVYSIGIKILTVQFHSCFDESAKCI